MQQSLAHHVFTLVKQASMPHAPTLLSAFSGMLSKSITKTVSANQLVSACLIN
jgi:hypothetical protein